MTDLCEELLFYIRHMQSGIHGVYSCHMVLIQGNLCCVSANQTKWLFTNQGSRLTPPIDCIFSRTEFAIAVSISTTFFYDI